MRKHLAPILSLVLAITGVAHAQENTEPEKREAEVGAQIFDGETPILTYSKPGVRTLGLPGRDIELTIKAKATPAPTPGPTTQPAPQPTPSGVILSNGGDLKAAARAGGVTLLERGNLYRPGEIRIARDNTSIIAFGDPSKPAPRVMGYISCDDVKGLTLEGINFDGTGISETGIRCYNTDRIRIANCTVANFNDFGIRVQGHSGHKCESVTIEGSLIANNSGGGKDSGLHFIDVYGWTLRNNVFDTNGWRPGKYGSTVYDHGAYIRANNSPGVITGNVFYNSSSHGLQARSGGDVKGNLFINNPIGMSYGYVNGNPVFEGGVSGEVSRNVFIGGRSITSGPSAGARGWAMEFGNTKAVRVFDNLIAHDNQNNEQAIVVRKCDDIEGDARDVGIVGLSLERIYCWAWPKGVIEVRNGTPRLAQVGIAPPRANDLRAALGGVEPFMAFARANPAKAGAEGVKRCFTAVGLQEIAESN